MRGTNEAPDQITLDEAREASTRGSDALVHDRVWAAAQPYLHALGIDGAAVRLSVERGADSSTERMVHVLRLDAGTCHERVLWRGAWTLDADGREEWVTHSYVRPEQTGDGLALLSGAAAPLTCDRARSKLVR